MAGVSLMTLTINKFLHPLLNFSLMALGFNQSCMTPFSALFFLLLFNPSSLVSIN